MRCWLHSPKDELSGRVVHLAVTEMPHSGTPDELREAAGISAIRIAGSVRDLVQ